MTVRPSPRRAGAAMVCAAPRGAEGQAADGGGTAQRLVDTGGLLGDRGPRTPHDGPWIHGALRRT
jgi:hypothetical protein